MRSPLPTVHRPLGAVAGGLVAGSLAAVLALVINLGILHAIGTPDGPGRLGLPAVASSEPSPSVLPAWIGSTSCGVPVGAGSEISTGAASPAIEARAAGCTPAAGPSPTTPSAPSGTDEGSGSSSSADD